ncbi:GNAT family N-acetyltransferase [Pedobacter aquatilis]|uniref:GNAT family N-acetyltransferase n=1 Tax=Pedobacter aquatilis TaxID=351343 RepID=UPI0025B35756|nr:GNAT family N-acetyltransferase [Pedobacter aquatilis]MDN3587736.1 GNAT family N-acetyltransferase [Pedobacter aquatilis]
MINVFPELLTSRLRLRQFEDFDLENVYQGLSNPDVIKHYGVHYHSLAETQDQLNWFKALQDDGTGLWWAICNKADEEFIGAVGFNNFNKSHKKIEIGFWLLPKYWKRGIINESATLICNYAFYSLHVNRIEAFVESENENSKKALLKLAFEYEGTMKNCEIKNGKTISLSIFAKLTPVSYNP